MGIGHFGCGYAPSIALQGLKEITMGPLAKTPLLKNGTILNGKWEILEHLATGGKGEVYRARQTNLDRDVVVKIVSVEYLAEFGDDEEEINTEIQRFHREALAMAQIRHPYVAQVYDQDSATITRDGKAATVQYVVMEYVPGGCTLRDTMPFEGYKDAERDLRQWIRTYFLPVFDGLETVHALGIIHRDMKPENVLLDGSTPKIIDFGIAGGPRWEQITRSHHVEGTITYMAPEQFMDLGETDARADVYALGKMLYEATLGKMVDSKTACPLKGVCLTNPNTPFLKRLDIIVQESTAEDKEKRMPSVKVLRDALERLLEETEASERPLLKGLRRKQIMAILAVVLLIAAGSNLYHHFVMTHDSSTTSHPSVGETSLATELPKPPGHETPNELHDAPIPTMTSKDGVTMRLAPSGQVTFPSYFGSESGKAVDVAQFYMDETEVTNYKYVEFLNQVASRLKIEGEMVHGDGQPWLALAPVYGGYEPIIYRNGRFLLKDASAAAYPVVKVTGYGASAYAAFYDKRLPTEAEWLHAAGRGKIPVQNGADVQQTPSRGSNDLKKEMESWVGGFGDDTDVRSESSGEAVADVFGPKRATQIPYPVTRFVPNADGIRGLNQNVSEWVIRQVLSTTSSPQFAIVGGLRGTMLQASTLFPGIAQDPSGAFEDVGFRCAAPSAGDRKETTVKAP
jgi:serine/threonine-protein kinase